ncbi:MAG: hypothetical protein FJX72_12090 [Armatimonadetes bacterium]|nr:hypothetical protein [Armatimonadota bacterium]
MTPRMGRSLAVAAALSAALCPCPCPAGQAGGEADPTIKRFAAFFRSVATGPVVTVKRRADVDWEARDGSGAGKARIADTTVSRRRPPVWPTSGAPRAITVNRLRRGSATALTTGHLVSWMHDTWQVDVVVTRAKGSTEALATDVADRLEQALSGQPVVPGTRPPMRSGGATPTAPPRETTSPDPTAPANPAGTGMLHLRTLHTITYEQISLFTANLYLGSGRYPMLSRNGQRIAFAMVPDQNDAEKRERVGVINLDGSGFRIVDAYKPQLYTSPAVTISGDGAWVASTEGRQVRLAAADGTGARTVVSFAANVGTVRLSHNGRLLYVQLMAPAPLAGSNAPLDRGIYVVNSDGSGLRQLVGTAAIAGALGIPPADVGSVSAASGMTGGMDLSEDGRRLVFGAHTRGADHVFAVNTDGSGLHRVFGPVQYCFAVAISGDGSRVAATLQEPSVAGYQGWVCDFAGGGARRLTAKAGYNDPIWLSRDGAFAVYGYESILYRTDGSARVPISTPASVGGGPRLNAERLQGLMMSGDPRRC